MNKKPIAFLQTDAKWKNEPYRVPGEKSTIGSAGCGPTCAAMVIATMKDKSVTPKDTCLWSVKHGYKALNQGTYYSYFKPQLAAYGIDCQQLLAARILNKPNHPIHDKVKQYLADGYYVIALMGPGAWTKSGHFVLLWGWDTKVRILDPASTSEKRTSGDPATFKNDVRLYWLVDARAYNKAAGGSTGSSTASKPAAPSDIKVEPAMSKSASYARKYKVTASALNMRSGAGEKKRIIKTLPNGSEVTCYGFYTVVGSSIWLLVLDETGQAGFCSKKYLQ